MLRCGVLALLYISELCVLKPRQPVFKFLEWHPAHQCCSTLCNALCCCALLYGTCIGYACSTLQLWCMCLEGPAHVVTVHL